MPRLLPLFLAALCLASASGSRSAESTAHQSLITATDLFKVRQIKSPALSPDGRWVVYVVNSTERSPAKEWVDRSHLWLAAVDGKTPPRQLTDAASNDSSPVWSPSGDRLAFVRKAERAKPQVYLLPPAGGEARPLTRLDTGATNPRWSPDGTRILFTSALSFAQVRDTLAKAGKPAAPQWKIEKPGRTADDVRNWSVSPVHSGPGTESPDAKPGVSAAADADGTPQEVREWLAKNEADGITLVANRPNLPPNGEWENGPAFSQFYTIEAREGAEPESVIVGYGGFRNAAWLADGKSIVCLGPRKADEHPDREHFTSLYRIDLSTGNTAVLLEEAGCNYAEPLPSPDGKWIACTVTTGGEYSFAQAMVAVVPATGGKPNILTGQLDRTATDLKWSPDSQAVYFTAADRGRIPLFKVTQASHEVQTLTEESAWGVHDFAIGSHVLVQVVTNPGDPGELFVSDTDGKSSRPLTALNSNWLKERRLSAPEPHRLVNKDGVTVDYWTMKPSGFDPTKTYPLLVDIHGGPAVMWGPGAASSWFELQYFAARGYGILFCNPRGSSGYGRDFLHADFEDWGIGPASDVLAAAGFTARESWIDRNRQVLTGDAYGGYLAVWILGHDRRFKAAVARNGIYDLRTFFGGNDGRFVLPRYWGGFPWQDDVRHLLDRDSPLTYLENITTPLLIEQGAMASPVDVAQGRVLYAGLKQLRRDVEYVRYRAAGQEFDRPGEPAQRLDQFVRFDEFFRRFIGDN